MPARVALLSKLRSSASWLVHLLVVVSWLGAAEAVRTGVQISCVRMPAACAPAARVPFMMPLLLPIVGADDDRPAMRAGAMWGVQGDSWNGTCGVLCSH